MRMHKQIDTIVHIGAGRCREYDEYKAAGARRIVLIEPDPESARYLRENFGGEEETQVIEKAVTASGGPVQLQIYNVRRFSSLREPTGLSELYPGLRTVGEAAPETWSPRQMCEELGIDSHKFNWLIVDAPGEEGAILENLREEGLLEQFEKVSLYAGISALYEGNLPAEKILSELEEMGYEEISMEDDEEPERPRWTLYRDEVKVRNSQLEKKIKELGKELSKLKAIHAEEKKSAEQRISELESREAELSKVLEERAEETEKLKAERDDEKQAREAAERERDENKKLLREKKEEFEQFRKETQYTSERQTKLNQEIIRAEAQVDLIKDVLLGDQNF